MNVIKELWHGNIIPQEDSRNNSKEMKELLGHMARHHEDLEKASRTSKRKNPRSSIFLFSLFNYIILSRGIKLPYRRHRDYSQSFGKIIILRPNMRRVFYG